MARTNSFIPVGGGVVVEVVPRYSNLKIFKFFIIYNFVMAFLLILGLRLRFVDFVYFIYR